MNSKNLSSRLHCQPKWVNLSWAVLTQLPTCGSSSPLLWALMSWKCVNGGYCRVIISRQPLFWLSLCNPSRFCLSGARLLSSFSAKSGDDVWTNTNNSKWGEKPKTISRRVIILLLILKKTKIVFYFRPACNISLLSLSLT